MSKVNLYLYSIKCDESSLKFQLDIWDEYLSDKELFDYLYQIIRWYHSFKNDKSPSFMNIVNSMNCSKRLYRFCSHVNNQILLSYPKSIR